MPAHPEELSFHNRLLEGDPQASAQVCERYLEELIRRLQNANKPIAPDVVEEAAIDALLDYVTHPERYQPDQKSLSNYLHMAASGDLKNKLAKLSRKARKEVSLFIDVGNDSYDRNEFIDEVKADSGSDPDHLKLRQKALAVGKGPQEQLIMELIMDNERDFRPYAEILGLSNKSVEEQRREVNQVKEKLRLRLRRSLKTR